MRKRYDAFCGLNCYACFVMKANESNKEELEDFAKESGISIEDAYCNGCKTDVRFKNCRNCKIRECCEEKGISFCNECNEYPCEGYREFTTQLPHLETEPMSNLESIKSNGLKSWLEDQKIRWVCLHCNERFSWYEIKCCNCGNSLKGYEVPEKLKTRQSS